MDMDSDEWAKTRSKKDTKTWCKGKVGREHTMARDVHYYRFPGQESRGAWHEAVCSSCGKRLKKAQTKNVDLKTLPVRDTYENGHRI